MRIAFAGKHGRTVTGRTLEEGGCGGSESALIYMALSLSQLGHDVHVFNRCGEKSGEYDGVKYHDLPEFSKLLKEGLVLDILVIFRDIGIVKMMRPDTTAFGIKKKVYWAHDDESYLWDKKDILTAFGKYLNINTDKVFAVSNWQAELYLEKFGVKPEKIFITRNGINPDLFKEKIEKENKRLIYTSVPDRGLDILVDIYPQIREKTGAELFVFSSFKIYGTKTDQKMEDLFRRAKEVGIHLMEPVKQKELARELAKSSLMVYPNHKATLHPVFAETSCIAVLEAQAAGTPVITSRRGALPESVRDGETGILIDGDPYSNDYKNSFIDATIKLLEDKDALNKMSIKARERIFDNYPWSKIAIEWQNEFNSLLTQ